MVRCRTAVSGVSELSSGAVAWLSGPSTVTAGVESTREQAEINITSTSSRVLL
jgi:hypothetical protein